MSETTSSKTTTQLKTQLTHQANEISQLRSRVNQLVDNIAILENELGTFKKNVSKDILSVIDAMKENQK